MYPRSLLQQYDPSSLCDERRDRQTDSHGQDRKFFSYAEVWKTSKIYVTLPWKETSLKSQSCANSQNEERQMFSLSHPILSN